MSFLSIALGFAKDMPMALPSSWTSLGEMGWGWMSSETCLPVWLSCARNRLPSFLAAAARAAKASKRSPSKGAPWGMIGLPAASRWSYSIMTLPDKMTPNPPWPHRR